MTNKNQETSSKTKIISEIENITGVENLKPFSLGDSLDKFRGKYKGKEILIRLFPKLDYYNPSRYSREGHALNALNKNIKSINNKNINFDLYVPNIIKEIPETTKNYSIRILEWIQAKEIEKTSSIPENVILKIKELFKEAEKDIPEIYSFKKEFLFYFKDIKSTNKNLILNGKNFLN